MVVMVVAGVEINATQALTGNAVELREVDIKWPGSMNKAPN